ncbi:MAG: FAD-dependent oxidoreductase, partial [Prolixibacteraceae bacterium]|nr:FAD-dependent oxidoreductase [Prolixibacteraceae bacterium]
RRLEIFTEEGIEFKTGIAVGRDVDIQELLANFDAVLIAAGAEHPRDLKAEGRELDGIYFAMDFLTRQNRVEAGLDKHDEDFLLAKGKKVLVIGGGDTGSDCVGTAIRQQAASVTQIEILPRPPVTRSDNNPWPYWPDILRTSSSHEEGCERRWGLTTKRFMGDNGKLKQAEVMQVRWERGENGKMEMRELPGTTELIETEMVLLAMGFLHPVHDGLLALKGLEFDQRGNIKTDKMKFTGVEKLFAAGDAERGASLVVHAIESGKIAASGINEFLIKPH